MSFAPDLRNPPAKWLTTAALSTLLLAASACQQQQSAAQHRNPLHGSWRVVSVDDKDLQKLDVHLVWTFTDKEIIVTADEGTEISRSPYRTDPSQTPKHFDMEVQAPSAEGDRLGIYEMDGEQLRLLQALEGEPRPEDWSDADGDVMVLERITDGGQ